MLTLRTMDPADALALFREAPAPAGRVRERVDAFCTRWGLRAFAAEEGGVPAGFALAASHPRVVQVLHLEGGTDACRLLLERVVRMAGERDLSGWVPVARTDLRGLLEGRGFVRRAQGDIEGRPSYLYCWRRNEEGC